MYDLGPVFDLEVGPTLFKAVWLNPRENKEENLNDVAKGVFR